MTVGIITVGRRGYVSGLYWENSPEGSIAQAAKDAAHQPGQEADFYAVRARTKGGRVPQFGLARAVDGARAGLPVLAACLANQQPGSWIGAFKMREGTAVVIVRDDLIVPDGDLFFVDEIQARDRLLQEVAIGGFQRVYAPESWGVSNADTLPLALLLNDKTDVKLQSVELPKQLVVGGGIAAAILLVVLGGGLYYQSMLDKEEAKRAEQERIAKKARNMVPSALQQQQIEYPPPVRVWEDKPLALNVVETCRANLAKIPIASVGWNLTSVKCMESSMTVTWSRNSGFAKPPEGASVSDDGNNASVSLPVTKAPKRGTETLLNPADVTKRVLAQNWGGSLRRGEDDRPPSPPPGFKGQWNPPPAPWVKRSFTLSAPVLPWTLSKFFADFPGLVVNSLSYSPSGVRGTWAIDGVIYENRR